MEQSVFIYGDKRYSVPDSTVRLLHECNQAPSGMDWLLSDDSFAEGDVLPSVASGMHLVRIDVSVDGRIDRHELARKRNGKNVNANRLIGCCTSGILSSMPSPYSKPPFPRALYKRFLAVAKKLGYAKRKSRWELMELMIQAAEDEPWMFRKLGDDSL